MSDRTTRIEIVFAEPVALTREDEATIADIVERIARANTPEGCVHWLMSSGYKPQWSRRDRRFLGMEDDPDAPESGEPTFDHSTLEFVTHCREEAGDE